jgi:hypothetical protein
MSAGAEGFAVQLRKIAEARGRERRARAIDELADSVGATGAAVPFLTRLAAADRHGRRLALEIALRLPLPLPAAVCRLLPQLLASPRFPAPLRINVAVQALRSVGPDDPLVADVLDGLVGGMNPFRAVERLTYLRHRLPGHPAVERKLGQLADSASIPCPRCDVRLPRAELVTHLWQEHKLLMDGSRARDPWKMIGDWLRDYARSGRRELLERSCELGQQIDPEGGLTRVHRLLLKAGLTDAEAEQNLTAQAEGRRASLCPHCYALVEPQHEPLPPPLSTATGKLAGHGYTVEVTDRYAFTRLFVATPADVLHEGAEPGHGLTARGRVLFHVGPLVLLALGLAVFLPPKVLPPLTPVALVLLVGFLLYLRECLARGPAEGPAHRAVDHAWEFIVPDLHRGGFAADDAAYLAGLAVTSIGVGAPARRERDLERLVKLTRKELARGNVPPGDCAALRCLEMDDALRLGRDPIPLLADEVAAGLTGELPLAYAEQLLEAWPGEARDQGQRARLRVLLCARAFEFGFTARDLQELGRVSPVVGQAYASEDLTGLARLRWLWDARPARLWHRNGIATTVFDLARYPGLGGQYLEERPDLLLFQPMSAGDDREAGSPILVCERAVVYRDIVINDPQTPIAVRARGGAAGGYEMTIGRRKLTFRDEPELLLRRLQGWVRFLFREVLPAAAAAAPKRTPFMLKPLLKQKTLLCPECGSPFLALRGEVGILTDAKVVR